MIETGGILTENTSNTQPLAFQFPKRNRIVAGMSDATIVIESQVKGGSMITAGLARGYNREVFAVPGKITDQKSSGCLALIRSNTAQLYQSPTQLLESLGWAAQEDKTSSQKPLPFELSPICQEILDVISMLMTSKISWQIGLSSKGRGFWLEVLSSWAAQPRLSNNWVGLWYNWAVLDRMSARQPELFWSVIFPGTAKTSLL